MDWLKIAGALGLVLMIAVLWPHTKQMLSEKHEVEKGAWMGVLLPILAVVGFVILLIMSVR